MADPTELSPESYEDPVARLLTIGSPPGGSWPDYPAEYTLTKADVPALLQVVQDEALHYAPTESDEVWAPLHAWRALGQLGVEEAVSGLLDMLYLTDEEIDDWMMTEMPEVLGRLGPGVLPALAAYLADPAHGLWPRVLVSHGIRQAGVRHPSARTQAVAILASQLAHHETQDPYLNAALVLDLTELDAVEAEEVMADAFAAGNVDLSLQGDWEEVQIRLGLLDERQTPVPEGGWIPEMEELAEAFAKRREMEAARARIEEKMLRQQWGKVGRNDPCPCESGKKYKRCHGQPG